MRHIDRLNLIDRIGRELQSRMTYSDIDIYLRGFGIDTTKSTTSVNSKWIYVKELLSNVTDDIIFAIADELEIEQTLRSSKTVDSQHSKFWLPGHFRLFLSHLSSFKAKTAQLQRALLSYGISAFVAHKDIKPSKEWQDEIEKALFSMDALAAILTPGFRESNWTDQETGVALGRGVLIIPIMKGVTPYGFIAKYQGLQSEGKTVGQVADSLFVTLATHPKTKTRIAEALVDQILVTPDPVKAFDKLVLLRRIETLPQEHLEKLRDGIPRNQQLSASGDFCALVDSMLKERALSTLAEQLSVDELRDDEIPF